VRERERERERERVNERKQVKVKGRKSKVKKGTCKGESERIMNGRIGTFVHSIQG